MKDAAPRLPTEGDLIDFLAPHVLPYAPSGWHELVPVAHWLVKATEPRVFVELGSHAGVSFSAFCDAMRRRGILGKAFAVDTWRGDEHAGHYSARVHDELRTFVDTHFKDFAQLMQMTFDEASEYFSPGSIDLLHIDGFHSYEAVRHDFEVWAPKMSERGVIVLHDVNCRNPGFGVWRFWEELTAQYPTFEFPHGNGLGLVALGVSPAPAIQQLIELRDEEDISRLRRIFSLAGLPHGRVYEEHARLNEERARNEERLAALSADRNKIDEDRHRIDGEREQLSRKLARTEQNVVQLNADLARASDELRRSKAESEQLRRALHDVQAERTAIQREAQDAKLRAIGFERDLAETLARHHSVISSISWRGTHPLRLLRARTALNNDQIALLKRAFKPAEGEARRVLFQSVMRRAGFGPPPAAPLPPPPPPPLSTDEDGKLIAALVQKGALPSMVAIVIMGDAPSDRLQVIIVALDSQIAPVSQIIVHVAEDAPARAAIAAICAQRPDVRMAGTDDAWVAPEIEAALLLSGTVTPMPEAAAAMAAEMRLRDSALVYADEVFVDAEAGAAEPFYKPAYSPRLATTADYIGNCALLRLEGRTPGAIERLVADAASAIDVASFVTATASALDSGLIANVSMAVFEDAAPRRKSLPAPDRLTIVQRKGTAAIIIPTRDRLNLLEPCVESILAKTTAMRDSYKIVVVDNGSTDAATLDYLSAGARLGKFSVVRDEGDFNYARLNNAAARAVKSDVLVFLNNDTLIIQGDWLERLIDAASEPGVGLVGAKLLYEDGTVQHGGVILGIQGVAGHADVNLPPSAPGYHGLAQHDREVSAVTGACMAVTSEHFWQAGGFDEKLAVAFNDTVLCINMLKAGLRNLQLNSVLVRHLESKSRGFDDTPSRKAKFFEECRYARRIGQNYFLNDLYYSPNLSLQDTYKPAVIARRRKPWRAPLFKSNPRVLILSSTHQRGHGVPVVIEQHADHFVAAGFDVHVGGPQTPKDFQYKGCLRAVVNDPFEAAAYAVAHDIDIIIPHTPPFFSVARWAGPYPIVAAYDHGEPPSAMFEDSVDRDTMLAEKTFSLSLSHRRYCNSASVRDDSGFQDMVVVPLGNSHMTQWDEQKVDVRAAVRSRHGWSNKTVVLNVCRFHEAERRYKGVDIFIAIAEATRQAKAVSGKEVVFVQCGKGDPEDVAAILASGIECFANVTEDEMVELYCAADIYANFSQWEGWNLGIAQALAYGLPVIASDIAAHRQNFDIFTTRDISKAGQEILRLSDDIAAAKYAPPRNALITPWEQQLKPFADDLLNLWRG